MRSYFIKLFKISNVDKYRWRSVIFVAFLWTLVDFIMLLLRDERTDYKAANSVWFREALVFAVSVLMGYLFVYKLKKVLRTYPLWINFILKSCILLGSALIITFLLQFLHFILFVGKTPARAYQDILNYALHRNWLLQKIFYWLCIFFVTQLFLIINEKYSPGVFLDILRGKYIQPKVEKRIVMFIDLKDSTPIAEKLGHHVYFRFIRDFIYQVSSAMIEYNGIIYQYVGDEVITSWIYKKKNMKKCLAAVIQARRNMQKRSEYFRNKFGQVPEFRVGIHVGDVTVGEIGVIKKDLAMSGDTMNTTARLRSACNELNQHFIVSKDFIEHSDMESWQSKSLGMVDLKGKGHSLELFSLQI